MIDDRENSQGQTQQRDLEPVFKDSPSPRVYAGCIVTEVYGDALDEAAEEMGFLTPLEAELCNHLYVRLGDDERTTLSRWRFARLMLAAVV